MRNTSRSLLPGEPLRLEVLTRSQSWAGSGRKADGKDMLGVVGDSLGIAMSPMRKDFVTLSLLPILDRLQTLVKARLLLEFALGGGCGQFLKRVEAASNRLPKATLIGPLKQQHLTPVSCMTTKTEMGIFDCGMADQP